MSLTAEELAEMKANPNLVPLQIPIAGAFTEDKAPLQVEAPETIKISEGKPKYGQFCTFAKCSLCGIKRYILVNLRGLFCTTCLKDLLDVMVKKEVESLEKIQVKVPINMPEPFTEYAIPEQKAQRLDRVSMGSVTASWGA